MLIASCLSGAAVLGSNAAADPAPLWTGDFPDPFVVRDGDVYYGFATSSRGAGAFHRIPVLRSRNLVSWEVVGDALESTAPWTGGGSLWAPAVLRTDNAWRLYYAAIDRTTSTRCIAVASAPAAVGPYRDTSPRPLICDVGAGGAIDPEVFTDRDGTRWLLWKSEGIHEGNESKLWSQQLSADGLTLVGPARVLLERDAGWEVPVVENPSMVRMGDRYVLFYSGGDWRREHYSIGYAVCPSPAGPCARTKDAPLQASVGNLAGPGGQSVFFDQRGRVRLAFHGWTRPRVGYEHGGARALHIAGVFGDPDALGMGESPQGHLDPVTREGEWLNVRGWAVDLDVQGSIHVHIYIDGAAVGVADAAGPRPDVDQVHPGWGAAHGYEIAVAAPRSARRVCAYGINVALGENRLLGCRAAR